MKANPTLEKEFLAAFADKGLEAVTITPSASDFETTVRWTTEAAARLIEKAKKIKIMGTNWGEEDEDGTIERPTAK